MRCLGFVIMATKATVSILPKLVHLASAHHFRSCSENAAASIHWQSDICRKNTVHQVAMLNRAGCVLQHTDFKQMKSARRPALHACSQAALIVAVFFQFLVE